MASTPLSMKIGETFRLVIDVNNPDDTPMDLTGAIVEMMARQYYAGTEPALSASTESDPPEITIDENEITIVIPAATTAELTYTEETKLYYDVKVTQADDSVIYVCEGRLTVKPSATREATA